MRLGIKISYVRAILAIVVVTSLTAGCQSTAPKQYADYSQGSGFAVWKTSDGVLMASGGQGEASYDSVPVESRVIENLDVLCRVWGLAKYHHPAFVDERLNADYELFEMLPWLAIAPRHKRNSLLLNWLNDLGEFRPVENRLKREIERKGYTTPAYWSWIEDENLLGVELSQKLQELRWAKRKTTSRYAWMFHKTFINFGTESMEYAYGSTNDTGYNVLALFRLWNMAEYYFPSVNITDSDWNDVLKEYIPKFLAVQTREEYKWTTAELIAELSDTHSMILEGLDIFDGNPIPAKLKFVEGKLVVADIRKSEQTPFELGDEIVSINGKTPEYFLEHARKYISASNENALKRDAARLAHIVNNTVFNRADVVVRRDGELQEFSVLTFNADTEKWNNDHTSSYELLSDNIGYINPDNCKNTQHTEIMSAFKNTEAIIVDMRCYPMGFNPFEFIGNYLVPCKTHHVTWSLVVSELPGYYTECPSYIAPFGWLKALWTRNTEYYKGKIVVLVNEETQSMAEHATMAFQAVPNCIVVGSQTAGADGNVVDLPLPDGIKSWFSGIGVYYPDGTNTQRTGVKIDHYVTPTIAGVKAGRDEVLEYALKIIESVN